MKEKTILIMNDNEKDKKYLYQVLDMKANARKQSEKFDMISKGF